MDSRQVRAHTIGRRRLLRGFGGLAVGIAGASALPLRAVLAAVSGDPARSLSFHALHTGERLTVTYWAEGGYQPDALAALNHVMRDWRTDGTVSMDMRTIDIMAAAHNLLNVHEPYMLLSGYRSPQTNRALAAKGRGVARRSLHQHGQAIDIRVPTVRLGDLRKAALALRQGGVGYYPRSNFVHVDTGRVRFW